MDLPKCLKLLAIISVNIIGFFERPFLRVAVLLIDIGNPLPYGGVGSHCKFGSPLFLPPQFLARRAL